MSELARQDPALRARTAFERALVLDGKGDRTGALAVLERLETADVDLDLQRRHVQAELLTRLGRLDAAGALFEKTLHRALRHGNRTALANLSYGLAHLELVRGHVERALELARQAEEALRSVRSAAGVRRAVQLRANALVRLGRLQEAEDALTGMGDPLPEEEVDLALLRARRGDPDAVPRLEALLESRVARERIAGGLGLALYAAREARWPAAARLLAATSRMARTSGDDGGLAEAIAVVAEAVRDEAGGRSSASVLDVAVRARAIGLALAEQRGDEAVAALHRQGLAALARRGAPVRLGPVRLLEPLGKGATGEVWRGLHDGDIDVAVKLLTAAAARTAAAPEALANELAVVAALDHPGIVRLLDSGFVDGAAAALRPALPAGSPYLVLECLGGGTLDTRCGDLPWEDCERVLLDVLAALAHAHARGVLHLDLKPSNVLLDEDGVPKLADFGLARAIGAHGHGAGTPSYMAPEQFWSGGRLGPWTDLYAVGCVAAALITGDAPVAGDLEKVREAHRAGVTLVLEPRIAVPAGVERWIASLLMPRWFDRPRSAAEAARTLRALGPADRPSERPRQPRSAAPESSEEATRLVPDDGPALPPSDAPPRAVAHRWPIPVDWRDPRAPRRAGLWEATGLLGRRVPGLVGRDSEQDALWSALAEATARRCLVVVRLDGAAGVGRSRLARWLAERASELGVADGHLGTPAEGLSGLLGHLLGAAVGDRELRRARVREELLRHGADPAEEEAFLRALAGEEAGPHLTRLLGRRSKAGPQVVVLDDVDRWPEAAGWQRELAETAFVGVVVAVGGAFGPQVRAVPVPPLGEVGMRALLDAVLPLEASVRERLVRAANGLPGLALQVLEDWIRDDRLELQATGHAPRDAAAVQIPEGTAAAWQGRVAATFARAATGERVALELAALLGPSAPVAVWERSVWAWGGSPDPALLAPAIRDGWLTRHDDALRVLAPSEAVDAAIEPARAAGLHEACAEAWGDEAPGRRGHHLRAAGRAEEAAGVLLRAAEQALDRIDVIGAEATLDAWEAALGLAGADEDDVRCGPGRLLRARVAQLRSDGPLLGRILSRLERTHPDGAGLHPAWWARTQADRCRLEGRDADELVWLERARAAFAAAGDPDEGTVLRRLADVRTLGGDPAGGLAIADAALARFGSLGAALAGGLRVSRIDALRRLGRSDEAEAECERALAEGEAAGALGRVAAVELRLGALRQARGDLEGALRRFRRASALYDAMGMSRVVPRLEAATILHQLGRHAEGGEEARLALPLARSNGPILHAAGLAVSLIGTAIGAGEVFDATVAELEEVLERHPFGSDDEIADALALAATRARSARAGGRADHLEALARRLRREPDRTVQDPGTVS